MQTISAYALTMFAVLIAGLSLWGVLSPANLVSFVQSFMHRSVSLFIAIGVRVLLAALLWMSAPISQTPTTFYILAAIMLLAALVIAIAGTARLVTLIEKVASWPSIALRLPCLLGVALALFLIWSVSPVWSGS